jgi:chemotaxis signal transduction protein
VSVGATAEAHCILERGGAQLAVPVRAVWRVLHAAASTPVPAAPALIAGLLVHDGDVLALTSLDAWLGLDPADSRPATAAVVVDAAGIRFAIAVDRLVGVEPLDDSLPREPALRTGGGQPRPGRSVPPVAPPPDDAPLILDLDALARDLIAQADRAFAAPSPTVHD